MCALTPLLHATDTPQALNHETEYSIKCFYIVHRQKHVHLWYDIRKCYNSHQSRTNNMEMEITAISLNLKQI